MASAISDISVLTSATSSSSPWKTNGSISGVWLGRTSVDTPGPSGEMNSCNAPEHNLLTSSLCPRPSSLRKVLRCQQYDALPPARVPGKNSLMNSSIAFWSNTKPGGVGQPSNCFILSGSVSGMVYFPKTAFLRRSAGVFPSAPITKGNIAIV